jgi:DNA mismatch repair protein MutL
MPSQKLLTPLNFDLSPSDADVLSENIDEIKKTGYEIESFGDASFAVYALPGFKTYGDDIDIILSLLDKIKDGRKEGKNDYLLDELLKIESCRSSFKSGDNPDINMLKAVIENVLNEQIPLTCPHGRPIVSKINKKELDKKFKRI